jgi:hypothetical protein
LIRFRAELFEPTFFTHDMDCHDSIEAPSPPATKPYLSADFTLEFDELPYQGRPVPPPRFFANDIIPPVTISPPSQFDPMMPELRPLSIQVIQLPAWYKTSLFIRSSEQNLVATLSADGGANDRDSIVGSPRPGTLPCDAKDRPAIQ